MKRGLWHVAGAAALAGAPVMGVLMRTAPARADSSLIGWTAQADANVVDVVVDNAAGLAGSHPLSEIDLPEDFSDFETGPLGYALAALVWPGAVLGNAGSLLGEAGAPSQLAPFTDKLNDPVRATSFYPAGPADATYPAGAPSSGAIEMTSHAGAEGSWAKAAVADVTIPSLLEVRAIAGSTTATASSAAKSTATGSFHSLSLLGGLIQVGATSSTASAQSDGTAPTGTSQTHLGAISVAGQRVSVGTDGIVAGPAGADLSGVLSGGPASVVNQVAALLDLRITPLPQTQTSQAPAERITSAGLQIAFTLPSNIALSLDCTSLPSQLAQLGILCTLPDLLQGLNVTVTIGRVTAQAIASPPFAGELSLGSAPAGGGTLTGTGVPGGPALTGGPGASPFSSLAGTGASVASTGASAAAARAVPLSSPTAAALVAGLMVVAVLSGLGLRKLSASLVAAPPAVCPREEEP